MSHNTFGHLFRVTTFGESHGPALGCIVDGCPPNIRLTADEIQFRDSWAGHWCQAGGAEEIIVEVLRHAEAHGRI